VATRWFPPETHASIAARWVVHASASGRPRDVTRWFKIGFVAHLALVVLISVGAYTGRLPTSLPDIPHADKLGHAVLIGGLAFFLDGAMERRRLFEAHAFPRLAPVLVLLVAGIEEYLQRLSPRRSSDLADFAADVVGVCFFTWLSARLVHGTGSGSARASGSEQSEATR
jgi:hypothetical protein